MRILVTSDLTARSQRALARAFQLAAELKAGLRVLHVVDEQLPNELKARASDWARKALSREMERLGAETGVDGELEITAGRPRIDIAKVAESSETDLLVLGAHDRASGGAGLFVDTTAGSVLKSSLTPTLLVTRDAGEPYRRVVVGVDFSMHSRAAIRQARAIAPGASMHLVHAYQLPFPGFLGGESVASEVAYAERQEFNAFLKDEMEVLEQCARELGAVPGHIETIVQDGDPREVLRNACRRTGADLLVIGTHGRARVSRAIWGSVAADLLEDPPCDMLVVRPF